MYILSLFALWIMPPVPLVAQIMTLVISAIFIIAVFWKWFSGKLTELLKGPFNAFYWMVFWIVYIIGWLKGLSSVSGESPAFPLVVLLGIIWFLIITLIYFKAVWQTEKRK